MFRRIITRAGAHGYNKHHMRPLVIPQHARDGHGQYAEDDVGAHVNRLLHQVVALAEHRPLPKQELHLVPRHPVVQSLERSALDIRTQVYEYPAVVQHDPPQVEPEEGLLHECRYVHVVTERIAIAHTEGRIAVPPESKGEQHGRYVNEHGDHLLPLVEHYGLVEGEDAPCQWAIRTQEYDLEQHRAVRHKPYVEESESIGPITEVIQEVMLLLTSKINPPQGYQYYCFRSIP